jgi:hypothetical protein
MLKDELPDDLVEFLQSERCLEYDASACEIGVFTFRDLEAVEEIELVLSAADQESPRVTRALDLLESCEEYEPRGMLVYIPSLRKYGSYNSDQKQLNTYRNMSWSDFVADPVRYINAGWYDDPDLVEPTFSEVAADRVVEVCSAANPFEAQLLGELLEEHGIRSRVVGDLLGSVAGSLPLGATTAPRIWVREGDAGRAREIIEERASQPQREWSEAIEGDEGSGANDEPEDEAEAMKKKKKKDTPPASEVRLRWFSRVFVTAGVGCLLFGAVWAFRNWMTMHECPGITEGVLVDHYPYVSTYVPAPPEIPFPHQPPTFSVRYDAQYAFVVNGKTYYSVDRNCERPAGRMPVHYDPQNPATNFVGSLTPTWLVLTLALAIGGLLGLAGTIFRHIRSGCEVS